MSEAESHVFEYFSGGVPTGGFFRITLQDIRKISQTDTQTYKGIDRLQEICFIGLFAYFEAFCKDHFASLINIEPGLITNLRTDGYDVSIDAAYVALYAEQCDRRMGFVLASKFDFGTARKINSLFGTLIKVTPFSKDEAEKFDHLLRDRNLLVHHGGVFTLSYLEQVGTESSLKETAFYDSKLITKDDVLAAIDFVELIARKLVTASHRALLAWLETNHREYSGDQKLALDWLQWG
jgi:hypothetical protein